MYEKLIQELHLERAKVRGHEVIASCPYAKFTHLNGKDTHPSFSLNPEKGVFNCYSCSKSGVIEELVSDILHISWMDAADFLESIGFSRLDLALKSLEPPSLPGGERDYFVPEAVLESFTLLDKTNEVYTGEVDDRECLVYPVRNYLNQLVGAVARSIEGRYHQNLWSLKKSEYLYGENHLARRNRDNEYDDLGWPLVIVEGVNDCIAVRSVVRLLDVVAIMGCEISDAQVNKLLRFAESFIVFLDADLAGERGTARLFKKLEKQAMEVRYVTDYPGGCKDPRDVFREYGKEKLEEMIDSSKSYLELLGE